MAGKPAYKLTQDQATEAGALAQFMSVEQIADYFEIPRRSFWNLLQRQPEVYAKIRKGKAKLIGHIAKGLVEKARDGDKTCMIFFLKTQARWRESHRHEVVGIPSSAAPLNPEDEERRHEEWLKSLPKDALAELASAMETIQRIQETYKHPVVVDVEGVSPDSEMMDGDDIEDAEIVEDAPKQLPAPKKRRTVIRRRK